MSIKAFAFSAQRRVAEQLGFSLQRSHVYEALAAAFGFASYASLCADSVFTLDLPSLGQTTQRVAEVARRLDQLGVPEVLGQRVASELASIVSEQGLRVVGIDQIIDSRSPEAVRFSVPVDIDGADLLDEDEFDDSPLEGMEPDHQYWDISDFLAAGLEDAAKRGNPKALYALSLIHLPEEDRSVGSSYWYDRQMYGDQLSGVQLEWALAHRAELQREEAPRLRHLREAARLGHPEACVDAAAEFDDPSFLRKIGGDEVRSPARVSEVAGELGQIDLAKHWCAIAAEQGHMESIRRMIEAFDRGDLVRCWTWLHFARLLGEDLTEDDYRLVNEDGSDYDDDVGGPGFAVGEDGITLPPLDARQHADARR